jgi:putative membrane protein
MLAGEKGGGLPAFRHLSATTTLTIFDVLLEHATLAPQFGFIMVCVGLASLVLAVVEHRRNIHELGTHYAGTRRSLAVTLAALVALLGVLALLAMILRP